MSDKENKDLEEIRSLIEELNKYNYEYYELNSPTIDDYIFDKKLKRLNELENLNPNLIFSDSPTKNVGGYVSKKFQKKKHNIRSMLSLQNAFNLEDLKNFEKQIIKAIPDKKINYSVEPKIDGLSISLMYENGYFIQALTRGDGEYGEDVTENVKEIIDVPKKILIKDKIEIRGEIYISINNFENINSKREIEGETKYANPRNLASGTLRQLDNKVVKERGLQSFFFNLLSFEKKDNYFNTQEETMNNLLKMGFKVVEGWKVVNSIDKAFNCSKKIENKRKDFPYEIDGAVIKVNDFSLHNILGNTTKFPKWAIALKFAPEFKKTKIIDIFPTIGRTGRVTYNAKVEPVNIMGTIVQRATLHNHEYIEKMNINIGDEVFVKKAGDIIPKVFSLAKKNNNKKWEKETRCLGCNSLLVIPDNEIDQYCVNDECRLKKIEGIVHFSSRDAMNIEGLSIKQIEKFFENNFINDFVDIYKLKDKKDEIIKLEGYKEKSVNNLLNSIEKSKERSLEKVLFALGIRYLGEKSSYDLAIKYKNIDKIMKLSYEELLNTNDFGEVKSKSLYEWISNEKNINLIESMKKIGINFNYISSINLEEDSILHGKEVIVTGKIEGGTRNQINKILIEKGATIKTKPSKNIDIYILGKNFTKWKVENVDEDKKIFIKEINEIIEL